MISPISQKPSEPDSTHTPAYQIKINDTNVTDRFQGRLVSLTLQDLRGFEADMVEIQVSDHDDKVALPTEGAELQLAIGWAGKNLIEKGTFTIQEIGHTGPPDIITIRAQSADFRNGLMAQKTRAWDDTTLGSIVESIAMTHGLTAAVSTSLAARPIAHLDQTEESDANLLTRLGVDNDAVATVKNGRLVFVKAGEGTTANGLAMPSVTIQRSDGDAHTYQRTNKKQRYTGVKARWLDTDTAQAKTVIAGEDGSCKDLKKTYPTASEAQAAVESEWRRIQRASVTFSLTLAIGLPELIPEQPVDLQGWKSAITDNNWLLAEVTHNLNDSGLTTSIRLEPKG